MNLHDNLAQFQQDRFGMFIHWGIYSMVGINEWARLRERISEEDYQFLIDNFDADLFNPTEWARAAKKAGMKHVVFTTKHHDGFCMWDTKFTDYKVTNSPARRDVLKEIVAAFRAEGIRIGLYYSISDWHHPDYLITKDGNHALDHLPDEEIAKLNEGRDMRRYAQYMRDQVRELLTEFGEIVEFWFDVSGKICPIECESQEMLEMIRSLQPNVILNNRLAIPGSEDILTPEGYVRDSDCVDKDGNSIPWEGCHCMTAAWGYNRDEKSYFKTPFRCLEILITQTSMNGNTLMNIGPAVATFATARWRFSITTPIGCDTTRAPSTDAAPPRKRFRRPPIAATPTTKNSSGSTSTSCAGPPARSCSTASRVRSNMPSCSTTAPACS